MGRVMLDDWRRMNTTTRAHTKRQRSSWAFKASHTLGLCFFSVLYLRTVSGLMYNSIK